MRRIVQGEGVERKFPSTRRGSPRSRSPGPPLSAAKLYFLRDRVGKAVRLKERRVERVAEAKAKPKRRGRKQRNTTA